MPPSERGLPAMQNAPYWLGLCKKGSASPRAPIVRRDAVSDVHFAFNAHALHALVQ